MTKPTLDHFAGLDDFPADGGPRPELPKAKVAEQVKHPCEHCGGNGVWQGRFKRGKCHACKGKGHFLTSAAHRKKTRGQVIANKAAKLADAQAVFNENHPGLHYKLSLMIDWNEFAASLVEQLGKRGSLSEKQIEAAERMIAKTEATRAARVEKSTTEATKVDLSAIKTMFEKAFAGGHKRPTYRAEDLIISRAPDHGRNAGALYVKSATDDTYFGKIIGSSFQPSYAANGSSEIADALLTIAADPRGAAVRYGQLSGSCSCCGRELTNPASVAAGIGPICASNFGL